MKQLSHISKLEKIRRKGKEVKILSFIQKELIIIYMVIKV